MTDSPYVQDPANPTDAELAAAIQRGLADGSLIDAEAWLADHECCGDCTPGFTVADRMAELDAQIAEPVITEGMTRDEGRAELDRYLADHRAQDDRLDEEHLLLGIGRTAAVCMTHEITGSWLVATADRWFRALPERYMTPDSLARPDWDHSHYPHDEHGHIGRVTTRQRPEATGAEAEALRRLAAILADDNC